jgi:alkylation response protein AidB-like acyl-CoA dehydrogenase
MWNILPSDDERMIADSARAFLAAELPLERLRPKPTTLVSWDSIRPAMAELGLFSAGLPEAAGGAGLGMVEEMLIQRECGRYVTSPAALAMTLDGHACAEAGDLAEARTLTSGDRSVGLALLAGDAGGMAPVHVFDWRAGDPLLGWTQAGIGLFPADALLDPREEQCTDESVSLHTGMLDLDRALHWHAADRSNLLHRARVLVAASLVGLAEHACDLTVDYAKIREQFGKQIGSFQAVKHRCADMGVRARLAWYQTNVACLKVMAHAPDTALQLGGALLLSAEAAHENARAGVQMHGAIGFQAECDVHWFVKRAHIYDWLAGGRLALARDVLDCKAA